MIYDERSAPDGLDDAVTRMWFLDGPRPRRYEKILPMPFAHVILNLGDPYRLFDRDGSSSLVPNAFVSGLQSQYLVIESPPRIRHVGIEFSPTGLDRVGANLVPATANRVQDADGVIDGIPQLMTRIATQSTPSSALDELARFIRESTHRPVDPIAVAAVALIDSDTERSMGDVAAELEVSHRGLVNRFRRTTGTTPKRHAQVVRFHRLIAAAHAAGGRPDWAALAATAGYYDQPHVIREFRRFSGWTPVEYFRLVAEHGPDAAHFVPLDHLPAQASS